MDNRGQATGIANFFLALIVGGVVSWLVATVTHPLFQHLDYDSLGGNAAYAGTILQDYVAYFATIYLFCAFFSLIVLAVYQRGMAGR